MHIPNMVMPIAWLNESAVVDDATADQIYSQLVSVQQTVTYVSWAALVLGVLLLGVAALGVASTAMQARQLA